MKFQYMIYNCSIILKPQKTLSKITTKNSKSREHSQIKMFPACFVLPTLPDRCSKQNFSNYCFMNTQLSRGVTIYPCKELHTDFSEYQDNPSVLLQALWEERKTTEATQDDCPAELLLSDSGVLRYN